MSRLPDDSLEGEKIVARGHHGGFRSVSSKVKTELCFICGKWKIQTARKREFDGSRD